MPATDSRLEEIKELSKKDPELMSLKEVVLNGWPESKQKCSQEIQKYWIHRGDIAYLNGLLVKQHQIIIPVEMRKTILIAIHEGHLGMEKCMRRARQSIFWPGINNEIKMLVSQCEECIRKLASKEKEPMLVAEVPTRPWQKVGSDLFAHGGANYIIITDYYSLYPEVYRLKSQEAEDVIVALKDSFSRHGTPDELFSDNGPCYKSHKMKRFARQWFFDHNTSSPRYPQSNGLAEVSVKSVKALLQKCGGNLDKFQKGMLILRNSPLKGGKSPAQLLFGRQLKDNLPSLPSNLANREIVKRDVVLERQKSKDYYDRHVPHSPRGVKEFKEKQRVVIQHDKTKEWTMYGTIEKEVAPRSYLINMDNGGKLRRNRRFVRKVVNVNLLGKAFGSESMDEVEIEIYNPHQDIVDDSDSDTIAYEQVSSEDDTIAYDDGTMDGEETSASEEDREWFQVTRKGRIVKKKIPTDYDDL